MTYNLRSRNIEQELLSEETIVDSIGGVSSEDEEHHAFEESEDKESESSESDENDEDMEKATLAERSLASRARAGRNGNFDGKMDTSGRVQVLDFFSFGFLLLSTYIQRKS